MESLGRPEPVAQASANHQDQFFKSIHACFQRAVESARGPSDVFLRIGEEIIRLRFAGPALMPVLLPALKHVQVEAGSSSPALTVYLWDSASTGVRMPPPAWSIDDYMTRGEVRGFNNDRFLAAFQHEAGILSLLDKRQAQAIFWAKNADEVSVAERAAPLRIILGWWMSYRGCQLVHAGGVGTSSGGVLIVGKGGAGKSSTALSCFLSPLGYAGDDYCLLAPAPQPTVFSLYSSAKIHAHDLLKFPFLEPLVSNRRQLDKEKAVCFLFEAHAGKLRSQFPLRAVLIPQLTGERETRVVAAPRAAGLKALAPTTITQMPDAGGEVIQRIASVVRTVPCFYLNLGTEMSRIPDVIARLLASL